MRDHVYSHIIWYEREFLIHLTFQMTFLPKPNSLSHPLYAYILMKRYDYETIFYTLLRAADEAVLKTRRKWKPSIGKI